MTINVTKFWGFTVDQLDELPTRQLLALLDASRSRMQCSCAWGGGSHCGDEVLSAEELAYNERQFALKINLKTVLATREHIPRKVNRRIPRRQEKKVMRY